MHVNAHDIGMIEDFIQHTETMIRIIQKAHAEKEFQSFEDMNNSCSLLRDVRMVREPLRMILESLKNVDEHVEVHKRYASEMELCRKIYGETCRMITKVHRPLRIGETEHG